MKMNVSMPSMSSFVPGPLVLPKEESSISPPDIYTNIDTDPTTKEQRTWGKGTMILYWFSDIVGIGAWQTAASVITAGLDWRQALIVKAVGASMLSVVLILNGWIGAKLHVPFPIVIRASFGYHFAKFPIVSRVIIAWFWFGINSWNGGSCIRVMLTAIWPSYGRLPNSAPAGSGFTTAQFVGFFIFWLIQFPCVFIHPTKLKTLFAIKAIYTPIVAIATLAWCMRQGGGPGALMAAGPRVTGSAYSSAWLLALASTVGSYSTLGLNIADYSRYCKKPVDVLVQAPTLPFLYVISAIFGVLSASATQEFHGKILWSPLDISALWLDNPGGRAAAFFCALGWAIATISNNISANSISAANDLATLFPKYFDIKRGQIITTLIGGFCMVPWKILANGIVFLQFISGYALILGPFAGIMISDYYLVKGRKLNVPALYSPYDNYKYQHGINWRAGVTLLLVVPPCLPGLAKVLNKNLQIGAISWIYSVAWIWGTTLSIPIYWGFNKIWPDKTGSLIEATVMAEDHPAFQAYLARQGITSNDDEEKSVSDKADPSTAVVPVVEKQ